MSTSVTKQFVIRVSASTKKLLDERRHPGQSYDGLMREMLMELDKAKKGGQQPSV